MEKVGIACQGSVFKFVSNRLNEITISTAYAELSIPLFFLKAFCYERQVKRYTVLQFLGSLWPCRLWFHSADTDGEEAMKYVHKQEKERNHINLVKLATQYVRKAAQPCIECTLPRGFLTKPNTDFLLVL